MFCHSGRSCRSLVTPAAPASVWPLCPLFGHCPTVVALVVVRPVPLLGYCEADAAVFVRGIRLPPLRPLLFDHRSGHWLFGHHNPVIVPASSSFRPFSPFGHVCLCPTGPLLVSHHSIHWYVATAIRSLSFWSSFVSSLSSPSSHSNRCCRPCLAVFVFHGCAFRLSSPSICC